MNAFRKELDRRLHSSDDGITLVEVMIAMLIFSIVSLGVVGTLIATANFANDSRGRVEATNLASQAIDAARAVPNIFNLYSNTGQQITVDGRVFTVNMTAQWVSNPSSVAPCGGGGGALLYKRVNVTVTWPGMARPGNPVEQDTLIAPTTRVSDPSDATILISTVDQNSAPVSGVTVTTSPALSPAATATDVDGCTYLLKVPVGTYTITVTKTGYVSPTQQTTQTATVSVVAGTSVSQSFVLAQAQPLTIQNASNASGTVALPTTMYESLVHSSDAAIDANSLSSPLALYPFPDGYSIYAGHYVPPVTGNPGCLDANPATWASSVVGGITYASPATPVTVPASTNPVVKVPMGLVKVKGTGTSAISAVQQTAATGADPGCGLTGIVYNFGSVMSNGTTTQLALPFGTYKLYLGSNGSGSAVGSGNITVTVPSTNTGNTVTLDPRVAQ